MYPSLQESEKWPSMGQTCLYPPESYFPQQQFPLAQQNLIPHPSFAQGGYQPYFAPPEQDQDVADPLPSENNVKGFAFNDATIRRQFICKVYGLLSVNKTFWKRSR